MLLSLFLSRELFSYLIWLKAALKQIFSTGSYPTVAQHSGTWSLNASTHSLDWSIPTISSDEPSGTLEFTVGGDDAGTFFPVRVAFVAQGSLIGVGVDSATLAETGETVEFSQDALLTAKDYIVV